MFILITGYCGRLRLLTQGYLTDGSLNSLFAKPQQSVRHILKQLTNDNEANVHKSLTIFLIINNLRNYSWVFSPILHRNPDEYWRNIGNTTGSGIGYYNLWCFTTDPNIRIEQCDVPFCSGKTLNPNRLSKLHVKVYFTPVI